MYHGDRVQQHFFPIHFLQFLRPLRGGPVGYGWQGLRSATEQEEIGDA
jgi:hypothetical protein